MVTFALIPGAGGSAHHWYRLEPLLAARGHQVVAVQLPAEDPAAGLEQYADTVVQAIGQAPSQLVVIAQSLGGFAAALLPARLPVAQIVFLNAMIPRPGETPGEWWDATHWADAKRSMDIAEGRPPDAVFDPMVYFLHDLPQAVLDELMHAPPPAQSDGVFVSRLPTDDSWTKLPLRVISGRDDRFFPLDFQRRVARERLGITPDEVPGGHLAALSQPAAVAERVLGYVEEPRRS